MWTRDLIRLFRSACLACAIAAGPGAAVAQPASGKVALVVGNGAYRQAPALPNPPNDASDVSAMLRGLGFEVVQGVNLDRAGMADAVGKFSRLLQKSEVALFFYAGHGLQVGGKNYLVPVDANLEQPSDLKFQTVDLDSILEEMEARRGVNLIFLDACRDNPFTRSLTRNMGPSRSANVGSGLASTQAHIGTLITFATQPNSVAADGEGRNSPFTSALIRHMATPGVEVRTMLTRVRSEVVESTKGRQVPWDHSSLLGDVYLKDAPAAAAAPSDPALAPELAFWQSIAASRDSADFDAYLQRYPTGIFADLARNRLTALKRPAQPAPQQHAALAPPAAAPQVPAKIDLRSFVPAQSSYSSEIAVSADETLVATSTSEHEIRIWDVPQKSLRAVLRLHQKYLKPLRFTPDGRYLVSFDGDALLAVWDTQTGRLVRSIKAASQYGWWMDVAENGTMAATLADGQITLWSLPDLRQIDTVAAKDSSNFVVLSADGSYLIADNWQNMNRQFVVYDRLNKRIVHRVARGKDNSPMKGHLVPGTDRAVISWSDGLLQIVDVRTGRVIADRREQKKYPTFQISTDGRRGVTQVGASLDIWDTATGRASDRIDTGYGMFAVGRDRVWLSRTPFESYDLTSRQKDTNWPLAREGIWNVRFVDDARKIVFTTSSAIVRFDLASGTIDGKIDHDGGPIAPNGEKLVVMSKTGYATIDPGTMQIIESRKFGPSLGAFSYIDKIAPGGRFATVQRPGADTTTYDLIDIVEQRVIAKFGDKSLCTAFSATGDRMSNQSADSKVDIRDMSGKILRTLTIAYREKYDFVSACFFTAEARELLVATGKGQVLVFDLSNGRTTATYQLGSNYFSTLSLRPDGRTGLAAQNKEIYLFDIANGRITKRLGTGEYVRAMSDDGRLLIIGPNDLIVRRADGGDAIVTVQGFADGNFVIRTPGGYSGPPGIERHYVIDLGDQVVPVPASFGTQNRKTDLSAEVSRALR